MDPTYCTFEVTLEADQKPRIIKLYQGNVLGRAIHNADEVHQHRRACSLPSIVAISKTTGPKEVIAIYSWFPEAFPDEVGELIAEYETEQAVPR